MSQAIIDLDKEYILQTYARADFVIERGEGCYLYDTSTVWLASPSMHSATVTPT
jgi:acetylornithine/succinyldiaminopimelate/putrescine aminotransferase